MRRCGLQELQIRTKTLTLWTLWTPNFCSLHQATKGNHDHLQSHHIPTHDHGDRIRLVNCIRRLNSSCKLLSVTAQRIPHVHNPSRPSSRSLPAERGEVWLPLGRSILVTDLPASHSPPTLACIKMMNCSCISRVHKMHIPIMQVMQICPKRAWMLLQRR